MGDAAKKGMTGDGVLLDTRTITVYCYVNTITGERYVGQTAYPLETRWRQHCAQSAKPHGHTPFHKALREHGAEHFKCEVLDIVEGREAANAAESKWIEHFNCRTPHGYNAGVSGFSKRLPQAMPYHSKLALVPAGKSNEEAPPRSHRKATRIEGASRKRWSEAETRGDEIAGRKSVPELVAVYEQAARDVRDGFELVRRAQENLCLAFLTDRVRVENTWQKVDWERPDEALQHVERQLWHSIVEQLEIRRFMSIRAAEALDRQLREDQMPPLNAANVTAMAEGFRSQLPKMLEESVVDVFRRLTPQSDWKPLKTNSKFEVGRKVIVSGMVEMSGILGWRVRYGRADAELTALENVFTALDGKGSVSKNYYSQISTAIKAAPNAETCVGETPYFKFRGFRNGNLHITFRRLDLLRRFNAVAGGANLKPPA